MTLDELKNQWKETSLKVEQLENDNARLTAELRGTHLRPSIDRLRSSYRGMMIASWVMFLGTYPFIFILFDAIWPVSVFVPGILWAVLFLMGAVADTWLYVNANKIDLATMSVEEVARRAIRGRKGHLLAQCLMIPVAAVLLWILFVSVPEGRLGMIIGGSIGLAFGLYKWLQIMRDYRTLASAL